eukprot:CAMPEP_0197453682 /NCGR_PEP_ID=MMETSP1175-20131217/35704_1 /TAXON_ID=1003142 /ORGANISM="Triceratium dubium, Strain CCMP147" /LENGTH=200 /DNA_ID=CAMNT_0042987053 /DNA_START=180 /DNA_END=782 /DNA_ORIENTATION=+
MIGETGGKDSIDGHGERTTQGLSCWRVAAERGGFAQPTGRAITTRRHGQVGPRPEILFVATLEDVGAGKTGGFSPVPTTLRLRSRRGVRSFDAIRLSEAAWDALPEEELEMRLKEERQTWLEATPEEVRRASTFRVVQDQDDSSLRFWRLDFVVYVCGHGLDGGTVSLSLDKISDDIENNGDSVTTGVPSAVELSIPWTS